jgi:hypothetical protein
MRLWTWELPKSDCGEGLGAVSPFPWLRTGPGNASDGKLRFDLSRFDQLYFDRLRSRTLSARDRGVYVSIMLFEGYGLQFCRFPQDGFPFSAGNNVNGIKAGEVSYLTLTDRRVTSLQEAYIRKVIDTVNDLDNVLYEISNESPATLENASWQYHLIGYIHQYEVKKPMRHPVIMSCQWSSGQNNNEVLFQSPAEAISPGWGGQESGAVDDYRSDPPAADGCKIIISDTDHLWGIGGDHQWVWKSFLRGLNPIFMDPYPDGDHQNHPSKHQWELIRKNMGFTLRYSKRLDLTSMVPRNDLSTTTYCLANPEKEYLVFLPSDGFRGIRWFYRLGFYKWLGWVTRLLRWNEAATVDLSASPGRFKVEWFNPRTGAVTDGGTITGGRIRFFKSPFSDAAVLYLHRESIGIKGISKDSGNKNLPLNNYINRP